LCEVREGKMTETWFDPIDVIADTLFDEGDAVLALLENGDTVSLFYGQLSDGEDDDWTWMGFYNEDGEEVFNADIKSVRLKPESPAVRNSERKL